MKTFGIRILDKINRVVSVNLTDILQKIHNGEEFYWSILFFDACGKLDGDKSIQELSDEINDSEKGLYTDWKNLNSLASRLDEIIDMLIIACKDKKLLQRYENEQVMYETCDIVIDMFDSGYWEVFSKDKQLIESFASKFKEIKFIESNVHIL